MLQLQISLQRNTTTTCRANIKQRLACYYKSECYKTDKSKLSVPPQYANQQYHLEQYYCDFSTSRQCIRIALTKKDQIFYSYKYDVLSNTTHSNTVNHISLKIIVCSDSTRNSAIMLLQLLFENILNLY